MAVIPYQLFRDYKVPKGARTDYFYKALNYCPEDGDIYIVSYPKCGTTLVQHILYLLLGEGCPADSFSHVISAIPFPEQDGFPSQQHYSVLKYHLPLKFMPFSNNAKYVYVARNPKDASVSYYHFLKNLPGYNIESFDYFFEAFLRGELPYGDILEHILEWHNIRNLPNILFITYESIMKDKRKAVENLAEFLDIDDLKEQTFQDIIKYSSFSFMKHLSERDDFMKHYLKSSTGKLGECHPVPAVGEPRMMRRGIVGDWRNYFSSEQSRRMDDYVKRNAPDLVDLWSSEMAWDDIKN